MIAISVIGLLVGFLSGMFGKGGSAIATPLLHLAGVPALVAVASPLPAVVPSTLLAAVPYWRAKHIDMRLVKLGAAFGVPATCSVLISHTGSTARYWSSPPTLSSWRSPFGCFSIVMANHAKATMPARIFGESVR